MKILKNFLILVLVFGSLYFAGQRFYNFFNPCIQPIEYSIGRFDTQFGLSQENFKSYLSQSEVVWEKALGRELFVYNPNAKFKVNLIFDERQNNTIQKQRTESGLESVESVFKKLDAQFNTAKQEYDARVATYESMVASLQARQKAYEEKVNYWNSRSGAPKNEYEALQREMVLINQEVVRVNSEGEALNKMAKELNNLLEIRNKAASDYNNVAKEYNKKYGHGIEFNQAEYRNSGTLGEINVYQFNNKNDLVLALSHEFGHALGMDHVENPNSIMYYVTQEGSRSNLVATPEDLSELKRVCKIK